MGIKVECKLTVYEPENADGVTSIRVESHWNQKSKVVLCINEHRYTLSAKDLRNAVRNCENTGGWV